MDGAGRSLASARVLAARPCGLSSTSELSFIELMLITLGIMQSLLQLVRILVKLTSGRKGSFPLQLIASSTIDEGRIQNHLVQSSRSKRTAFI